MTGKKVAYLCREIGYPEAALWITENPGNYLKGILGGFESLKQVK